MGQTTPNISIFIPSAGETNYDASFLAGMINIDQHDHTGAPTKGVPINSLALADGSVTFPKLNANVADTTTGIGTDTGVNANKLIILGLLASIYQNGTATGILSKNGSTAFARTITSGDTNRITVTNGDGASGNPTITAPDTPDYDGVNNGSGTFNFQVGGITQAILTSGLLNLAINNIAIRNGTFNTPGIGSGASQNVTGFTISNNSVYLAMVNVKAGAASTVFSQISIVGQGDSVTEPGTANIFTGPTDPTLSISGSQVVLTNNAPGSLEFHVNWIRLL